MNDFIFHKLPEQLGEIEIATNESGFSMPSERKTGSLLKTLASSKPGGKFLELGTGTGLSTAWLLSGMCANSSLLSVDNDEAPQKIAVRYLDSDPRVTFLCEDGFKVIQHQKAASFDLIFADAWPGKYFLLDETLELLKPGGFYVIDDMLPQSNWPEGHDQKAAQLLEILHQKENFSVCQLEWATGVVICTRLS
ncbi:O-methyltransferase [Rhodohalobacter sp. 614A]|uniref:O-methyltransferase n=1 Tax=Rhodohalobacter sp. 614A TaxID=2908649 RepID=UPI001F3AFF00|nr:class I SAM-dependent methyltransferase [Rhodohalobacter sp. 614A]